MQTYVFEYFETTVYKRRIEAPTLDAAIHKATAIEGFDDCEMESLAQGPYYKGDHRTLATGLFQMVRGQLGGLGVVRKEADL